MEQLNDKHQFCTLMKSKDLAVPESYIVKSNEEVHALNAELSERMEHSPDD